MFPPSLINFSPKIPVFLKIALHFLGMQLRVSPAEVSRGSDPKASAFPSSRRPSADSSEGYSLLSQTPRSDSPGELPGAAKLSATGASPLRGRPGPPGPLPRDPTLWAGS